MKWQIIIKFFCLLLLVTLLNGCFMPSCTHSKGTVSVQFDRQKSISDRFIIVSFWEYPMVNDSRGKVVINEVILSDKQEIKIKFPLILYWAVWTPALGTQHLAPEPGIMVFHNNYPLKWNTGGTDTRLRVCCEKPETIHNFEFVLESSEEDRLLQQSKEPLMKMFFEDFLAAKEHLMKKIDKCKSITFEEKEMVLEKLKQIEMALETQHST